MSYTIGLYEGSTWRGKVELDTFFVMEPADYTCEPRGVLTNDEVCQIAKVLRRAADIAAGVVGRYDWREEHPKTNGAYFRRHPSAQTDEDTVNSQEVHHLDLTAPWPLSRAVR